MGHAIAGVEGVYDRHSYREEKADALRRLAGLVETDYSPARGKHCADPERGPVVTETYLDLECGSEIGVATRLHVGMLEAWMLWPDDVPMRRRAFLTVTTEYAMEVGSAGKLSAEMMEALLPLAAYSQPVRDVREQSKQRRVHGMIAGLVVYRALRLVDRSQASSGASVKQLSEVFKGLAPGLDSKSLYNRKLKPFRSVAHFWAAYAESVIEGKNLSVPVSSFRITSLFGNSR